MVWVKLSVVTTPSGGYGGGVEMAVAEGRYGFVAYLPAMLPTLTFVADRVLWA